MEVIGTLAAIPGLIELALGLKKTIESLASKRAFIRETTELIRQLDVLTNTLKGIEERWRSISLNSGQLQDLPSAISLVRQNLTSLDHLLKSSGNDKNGPRFLKRVKLVLTGFEKTLKDHIEKLERSKTALTLVLVTQNGVDVQESLENSRLNHLLELERALQPCSHDFIPPRLDHTCEWIWQQPRFIQWVQNSQSTTQASPASMGYLERVFCIYGIKGCGKTVLAASIADRLRTLDKIVSFFSFWTGSLSQRKMIDMLRTVLWSLLQRLPDDRRREISGPLIQNLPLKEASLQAALSTAIELIQSDIYCIIDGVDESLEEWSRSGDGCFQTILGLAKAHSNFRVVLLGREPSMVEMLRLIPGSLEVTERLVKDDITRVIDSELSLSPNIESLVLKQQVRETLQQNSNIMFLWVNLIFKELRRCFSAAEIKDNLQKVPRDLDREYSRMFAHLQARTGGTVGRPSTSMQRSKRLLSMILSAPEPLTLSDLQHAYAIQVSPNSAYRDNFLTKEGIMDACGDFIRETDGRYHIIHASVKDFLTRPLIEWQYEDRDVIFFKIDPAESHQAMCFACLDYFSLIELGYPIADGSSALLPSKFPFLSYAISFALFHATEVYSQRSAAPVLDAKLESFLKSPQFCVLFEFLILISMEEPSELIYRQIDSLQGLYQMFKEISISIQLKVDFADVLSKESSRRQDEFGQEDPRTISWAALESVFTMILPVGTEVAHRDSIGSEHSAIQDATSRGSRQQLTKALGEDKTLGEGVPMISSSNHLLALPDFIGAQHDFRMVKQSGRILSQLRGKFSSLILRVVVSPDKVLPTPVLLICAYAIEMSDPKGPWARSQARQMASAALERLRGKGSYLESVALHYLSTLMEADEIALKEALLRESLDISMRLPSLPHVELLVESSLLHLVNVLFDTKRHEEALELTYQLEARIIQSKNTDTQGKMWAHKIYKGILWQFWTSWVVYLLANSLYYDDYNEETARMSEKALSGLQDLYRAHRLGRKFFSSFLYKAINLRSSCLYDLERYEEAQKIDLNCLETLLTLKNEPRRLQKVVDICYCLLQLEKFQEAKRWMSAESIDPAIMGSSSNYGDESMAYLGQLLMRIGDYGRAIQVYQKLAERKGCKISKEVTGSKLIMKSLGRRLEKLGSHGELQGGLFESLSWMRVSDASGDSQLDWWLKQADEVWEWGWTDAMDVWDLVLMKCIDMLENLDVESTPRRLYCRLAGRYAACNRFAASIEVYAEAMRKELSGMNGNPLMLDALELGARMLIYQNKPAKAFLVCRAASFLASASRSHYRYWYLAGLYFRTAQVLERYQPGETTTFLLQARDYLDEASQLATSSDEIDQVFDKLKDIDDFCWETGAQLQLESLPRDEKVVCTGQGSAESGGLKRSKSYPTLQTTYARTACTPIRRRKSLSKMTGIELPTIPDDGVAQATQDWFKRSLSQWSWNANYDIELDCEWTKG